MIERHLSRIICENPDKQDVQRLYPGVFPVCQRACRFLEKRFGTPFSEDELNVLTILIVSAMEQVDNKLDESAHLRIAVVCPNEVSESKLLCSNLVRKYSHFEITSVLLIYRSKPFFLEEDLKLIISLYAIV